MDYPTIEETVGHTPLVRLQRLPGETSNRLLAKLESHNPAGSVKDRPARNMIVRAEARGEIKPGDTLIEATSGNTGIALAMVAAMRGYRLILIMPDNMSMERRAIMKAYGAELIQVPREGGMEAAIDLARCMEADGEGHVLDQFSNPDNPLAHYETTGPEIWRDTHGRVTHFVSAMGTTGTIMGEGASIPGIRRWKPPYAPEIFDPSRVDRLLDVSQQEAEEMARRLAAEEGIFGGISAGGAMVAALRVCAEVNDATIVTVICDRGDRYLSTKVFPA